MFSKQQNWRRIASRYDKTLASYLCFVALTSIKLWIPFVHEALNSAGFAGYFSSSAQIEQVDWNVRKFPKRSLTGGAANDDSWVDSSRS